MADVIDIGGGFKQFVGTPTSTEDTLTQTQKIMGLQDLANRIAQAPVEKQKVQLDVAEKQKQAFQSAFLSGVSGDFDGANQSLQSIGAPFSVAPHPDPIRRNKGFVVRVDNNTGQTSEIDPYAEARIKEQIQLQSNIAKRMVDFDLDNEKSRQSAVQSISLDLINKNAVSSPREALEVANAIVSETRKKPQDIARLASLNDEERNKVIEARTEVNLALRSPTQTDPLSRDLRPKSQIPETERSKIADQLSTLKNMNGNVLSKFIEINNSLSGLGGQTLLGTKIGAILNSGGIDSRSRTALRSLVGQNLFSTIKQYSGTGYSDKQLQKVTALVPTEDDTLDQAIAKIAAINATLALEATDNLDLLEANRADVTGVRKLFGLTSAIPGGPNNYDSPAQTILATLPEDIKQNREQFSKFVDFLPIPLRRAIDSELSRQRTPRPQSVIEKFRSIVGTQ